MKIMDCVTNLMKHFLWRHLIRKGPNFNRNQVGGYVNNPNGHCQKTLWCPRNCNHCNCLGHWRSECPFFPNEAQLQVINRIEKNKRLKIMMKRFRRSLKLPR
jgi:hypothetical protein